MNCFPTVSLTNQHRESETINERRGHLAIAEQAVETWKTVDETMFYFEKQTDGKMLIEESPNGILVDLGSTEPFSNAQDPDDSINEDDDTPRVSDFDVEDMETNEIVSISSVFSVHDFPGEETLTCMWFLVIFSRDDFLSSDSTTVFSDHVVQWTALLDEHSRPNQEQENQCTLSIEESKSIDALIGMKQTF